MLFICWVVTILEEFISYFIYKNMFMNKAWERYVMHYIIKVKNVSIEIAKCGEICFYNSFVFSCCVIQDVYLMKYRRKQCYEFSKWDFIYLVQNVVHVHNLYDMKRSLKMKHVLIFKYHSIGHYNTKAINFAVQYNLYRKTLSLISKN